MFKIFLSTYSTNLWVGIPHYHGKRSQRCMYLACCHHQYIHQRNSLSKEIFMKQNVKTDDTEFVQFLRNDNLYSHSI